MRITIALLALIAITISACRKNNSEPVEPYIANLQISTDTVFAGAGEDTLLISFRFRDGDGNIGGGTNVFAQDNRFPEDSVVYRLSFPTVDEHYKDAEKGISGTAYVPMNVAQYFIKRSTRPNVDTLTLELYIRDEDGLESNHLETQNIYIL